MSYGFLFYFCLCVCVPCTFLVPKEIRRSRGQKRVSEPLELELQMVLGQRVGTRN